MIRLFVLMILNLALVFAENHQVSFENSNFTLSAPIDSTTKSSVYNYNRFRITASLNHNDWFLTSIGDVENYLGSEMIKSNSYIANRKTESDTPFSTQTKANNYGEGEYFAKLYRLYWGYADASHRVSFGLQKISMGVGRIWNPTDMFNPKNPFAFESDEVYGVYSLLYTYALNDLSQITVVVAEQKNHTYKYASRIKGYVEVVDIALNLISSDDSIMLGYEIEGELFESGIAFRSEGAWFEDKLLKKGFFQGIIGADYTFENSLSFTGEWLYSSKTKLPLESKSYGGLSVGYEFDALLYGTITSIINSDDKSFYLAPSLRYSLADDMTLLTGAMLYGGKNESEFGNVNPTYYLNFKVTF